MVPRKASLHNKILQSTPTEVMFKVWLTLDANNLQNKLSQGGGAAAYTVCAAAYTAGAAAYTAGAAAYMRTARIKLSQSS